MSLSYEMLFHRINQNQTFLCCGLDPDLSRFPSEILSQNITDEEKVLLFLQRVVDVTAEHVCAYKAQKAYFDLLPGGHDVLKNIVAYVHQNYPEIPVIIDCKIGDIDNTMQAYLNNIFGRIKANGIVVNPYMGDDVMDPCKEFKDRMIVVLVKTSNLKGSVVQDLLAQDGRQVWEHVLDLVVTRWNDNRNMIPVISSAIEQDFEEVRKRIPDEMPILLAGVGAQGGSYTNFHKLLNSRGSGVFVNSSRKILYPYTNRSMSWYKAVEVAAIDQKNILNEQRR